MVRKNPAQRQVKSPTRTGKIPRNNRKNPPQRQNKSPALFYRYQIHLSWYVVCFPRIQSQVRRRHMVILECTEVCVCKCCGGCANRLDCTCPCNKCTCARSRHKRKQDKIAGIEKPKKSKIQLPKQKLIKFVEMKGLPRNTNTSTKQNKQESIPRTAASVLEYPKGVAEQTFVFCYDEEKESRAIAEQTPAAKVPRPTPNSTWKGMCMCACVDLCVRVYGFVCVHVWICVCACMDLCVRMCGFVWAHV
jgi:hypothetical protein